jgi:enterochelin esterase-like enzyme
MRMDVVAPPLRETLRCEVFLPQIPARLPRGLPVVILLHGGGGQAADFRELGAAELAIRHRMVLVAPEGEATGFLDAISDSGDLPARALREALLPALERRFRISRKRRDRAILGVSLGGFAALDAGLSHPESFGFVGALSGVVEWPQWGTAEVGYLPTPMQTLFRRAFGEPEDPTRLRFDLFQRLNGLDPTGRQRLPYIHLACGTEDMFLPGNKRLAEQLKTMGSSYTFVPGSGGHDPAYWKPALAEAVKAYARWRNGPVQKKHPSR